MYDKACIFFELGFFMVVLLVPLFMFRHPIESFLLTLRVHYQYDMSRSMASVSKFKSYGKVNEFSLDELQQVDILWPSCNKQSFNQVAMQAMYQISEDGDIKRLQ